MSQYVKYVHHEVEVSVREDIKGKHRDYCLCYSCNRNVAGEIKCQIAKKVYETCKHFNIVSPVMECPVFVEATEEEKIAVPSAPKRVGGLGGVGGPRVADSDTPAAVHIQELQKEVPVAPAITKKQTKSVTAKESGTEQPAEKE